MIRPLGLAFAGLLAVASLADAAPAPDSTTLRHLLDDFLAGAGRNDVATHQRFWADDLIYTGSSGRRVGKADILKDVRSAPPPLPDEPMTVYSAEDVRIHQYGSTAIVAFRLVATTTSPESTSVMRFFNTGTFVERRGEWRAVAWQATRIPEIAERPAADSSGTPAHR